MAHVPAAWGELEQRGIFTYFQTRAWCLSWLTQVGSKIQASAVIVVGLREDGSAALVLPLQIRKKHGFLVLEFLSAPHASYGFGLFDEAFLESEAQHWFEQHFDALLNMMPRHDTVYLRDLPETMLGYRNPLLPFARLRGANRAYMMALNSNFEYLLNEKRGAETLRSMRKRDKRLADAGELNFSLPNNATELKVTLERMFSDHEQRLAETGVRGVYGPIERNFLSGLADSDLHGAFALKPYTLSLNGEAICILSGGRACNVFWAMITSLADGPWRKHSPGDYTLRHVIAAQCADGLSLFDFATGDSDYKLSWADTKIEMHLILRTATAKGLVLASALALKYCIKRMLKTNITLRKGAFALRKLVFGRRK